MSNDSKGDIDEWADKIAALEADVRDGILAKANRMAANRRLRKADRDFAHAQVEAISRAIARAKKRSKADP